MTVALRALVILTLLFLGGCGVHPEDIKLTQNSTDAVVLLRILPNAGSDHSLIISLFNPQSQQVEYSVIDYGTWERFGARKYTEATFVARTVRPGTYAFFKFEKQSCWELCFQRDTMYFTIKPGQILFLGDFNPNVQLAELAHNVSVSGQSVCYPRKNHFQYFDNVSPPRITAPTSSDMSFAEARRFVASSMPQVHAEVQPVAYTRTSFGIGHTLLGGRFCGGYFMDDAEGRKPSAP